MTTQEISCYIVVRGEATHPDDEGLEGIYQVSVQTSLPVDLNSLTDSQAHPIAEAVLDEFHDHQGIEELDDFVIRVYLENGREISESNEVADFPFTAKACYIDKVDADSLDDPLAFLAN